MTQLKLYGEWLIKRFNVLNIKPNRKWIMVYIIFSLFWWLGAHLIFLKKYKRAILYLVAWLIIVGSWIATHYVTVPILLFVAGVALLLILFLADFSYVYFNQRKSLHVAIPALILFFLFSIQLNLYEYLVNNNFDYLKEHIPGLINHFQRFS